MKNSEIKVQASHELEQKLLFFANEFNKTQAELIQESLDRHIEHMHRYLFAREILLNA